MAKIEIAMHECVVCGQRFPLEIKYHYISRDDSFTGLAALSKREEPKLYDTFDCPVCGCQNVVQERKRSEESKEPDIVNVDPETDPELDYLFEEESDVGGYEESVCGSDGKD